MSYRKCKICGNIHHTDNECNQCNNINLIVCESDYNQQHNGTDDDQIQWPWQDSGIELGF